MLIFERLFGGGAPRAGGRRTPPVLDALGAAAVFFAVFDLFATEGWIGRHPEVLHVPRDGARLRSICPWKRLADEGLIAWPDAAMVAAKRPLYEFQLPDAKWFQGKLSDHGYNTSHSGEWDALTRDSLISFQMKYRPAKYDGRPDAEIAALLDVVNAPQGMVLSKAMDFSKPYTSRW